MEWKKCDYMWANYLEAQNQAGSLAPLKFTRREQRGYRIIEARRGFWMTGDFDDLKFPVKWEIRVPWFVHRAKKKIKKRKKTKVQRSLIFLPFEIVAKFYKEFLSAKDFQDINNTKRWIRRKLRMDVKKIVKCGKWWPPLGGSCCNRFTIYHSVPDFKHSSYTRAQWTAQSVTYEILVNLYIYIYIHRVTVKLRGNEESGGNGLNFVRKWEERGRRKKKYRILN